MVPPEQLKNAHFLSVEFIEHSAGARYAVVGASDGSIVAWDYQNEQWVDFARGEQFEGQVGAISIKTNSMVAGTSRGYLYHYPVFGAQLQPEDPDAVTTM